MPRKRYIKKLTQRDIIKLFRDGVYSIDYDTATFYGYRKRPVIPFEKHGYLFVRLYAWGSHVKVIGLAKLVWTTWTGCPVPRGFQIHHKDKNPLNNHPSNLFCLHKKDHEKLHGTMNLLSEEGIPF